MTDSQDHGNWSFDKLLGHYLQFHGAENKDNGVKAGLEGMLQGFLESKKKVPFLKNDPNDKSTWRFQMVKKFFCINFFWKNI